MNSLQVYLIQLIKISLTVRIRNINSLVIKKKKTLPMYETLAITPFK